MGEFVRKMIQILLSAVGALAGIASMVSLYFWLVSAYFIVSGDGPPVSFPRTDVPLGRMLLFHAHQFVWVVGGAIGWLSFFALFAMAARPWNRLPRWVIWGCVVGVVAVLVRSTISPALGLVFGGLPILAVGALLLRAYLAMLESPAEPKSA